MSATAEPQTTKGKKVTAAAPRSAKATKPTNDDKGPARSAADNQAAAGEPSKAKPVPRPEDEKVMKIIKKAIADTLQLQKKREEINAQVAEVIATVEAQGVNRHAFRAAVARMQMNESKKEGWDLSYTLTRAAGGDPVQTDWVDITEPTSH